VSSLAAAQDALEPRTRLVKLPAAILASLASDATRGLFWATSGRETGSSDFLEALSAEAASGSFPPDVDTRPLHSHAPKTLPPSSSAARHRLPAAWKRFPGLTSAARRALRQLDELGRELERLDTLQKSRASQESGPQDRNPFRARDAWLVLADLIRFESCLAVRLGDLLAELQDRRAWQSLGFANLDQYTSDRLGMSPSACRERVALARGLRRLAVVRNAYEAGKLTSAATLRLLRLARRADPDLRDVPQADQRAWVAEALEVTVKRLDDDARIAREKIERERLRRGRRAVSLPLPADDEEWFRALRRVPGQTREYIYSLGYEIVEQAKRSWVTAEKVLAFRLREEVAAQFLGSVEAARRRLEGWAGSGASLSAAAEARLPPSYRIARLLVERLATRNFSSPLTAADIPLESSGPLAGVDLSGHPDLRGHPDQRWRGRLPAWVGYLAMLEEAVEVWDDPRGIPRRQAEAVYELYGYRCFAPGCRARRNLEDHHIVYRAHRSPRQGGQALTNRLCACRVHHQLGEHGGFSRVRGRAPLDVIWRLGRPEIAVWYRNERRLQRSEAEQAIAAGAPWAAARTEG